MNPYRLPRTVVPSRYDVRLEPDLTTATFTGTETVAVTVAEPVSEIWLNAVDLVITAVSVENDRGDSQRGSATAEPATERYRFAFATPLAAGACRLRLEWNGSLNDKLRGFYRSTYKDPVGVPHIMAATQFEATDARRAFPCWDEPDFKAVFDTAVSAGSMTSVVAKTALKSGSSQQGNARRASVASNCVAAIVCVAPPGSLYVLR